MNAAIAQHLNVVETAIVRIEEWANVLFVVVRGIGARFVSKKAVKKMANQSEMVNAINAELNRLMGWGVESTYGTYAEVEAADGQEFIRLQSYCSGDNGYLDGTATLAALRSISSEHLSEIFPTYKRGQVLSNAWVWGRAPQYVQNLNAAMNCAIEERI